MNKNIIKQTTVIKLILCMLFGLILWANLEVKSAYAEPLIGDSEDTLGTTVTEILQSPSEIQLFNEEMPKEGYETHVKLGLIGSKTYAQKVAKIIRQDYDSANVVVVKEGKYYRVYADFTSKTAAKEACKDLIKKEYIINYYFYKLNVKIDKTQASMCVGDSFILTISGTSKRVKWSTSNKSIATVTAKGEVKAKKKGTATIWANVGNKKYSCIVTVEDIFTIEDGVLIKYNGKGGAVIIPDSVTSIGDYAFYCCKKLASITIPDTVTNIGESAFRGCEKLTSITIPDSVISIGSSAFRWCYGLTNITMSKSITSIEEDTFIDCFELTSITIPDTVTSIEGYAFYDCRKLTTVDIPDSVTSIEGSAFTYTPWLAAKQKENPFVIVNNILIDGATCTGDIVIPDGVTSIGNWAFRDCSNLTSVIIPDSVNSIGDNSFINCDDLTSITLPNSITSIGEFAFCNCYDLTSIILPNSVTSIGDCAFGCCYELTNITIPSSVASIGDGVFDECGSEFTISGAQDSYAQTYAQERGIKFTIE